MHLWILCDKLLILFFKYWNSSCVFDDVLFLYDFVEFNLDYFRFKVKKMENLLRAKLVVLAKKRESLMKNGQWNEEARLHLLAEKLAYESVLVGRLHDAITVNNTDVDTTDAERLIQVSSFDIICKSTIFCFAPF